MHWISGEPECGLIGLPEYGSHGLVCRYPGNCRLVVSVPHGGEMKPPFVEDRRRPASGQAREKPVAGDPDEDTASRITTAADIYTQEMALVLVREYCRLTGCRPHLVMCNLHRSKLDPNRPLHTAAEDPLGQQVYAEYHSFLEAARAEVGRGLVLDLHGQNHQQNSIELGYLYKRVELNAADYSQTVPSVASLLASTQLSPRELLTGSRSLGALLEEAGYRAVPSPRQECPGEERYYKGGHITQTHGSSTGGQVDAIQMEVPAEIRHEGGETYRTAFSKDLARVMAAFMELHYTDRLTEPQET